MTELNGSNQEFANVTNHTFYSPRSCTGSGPSKTAKMATYLILMTFSLMGNVLVVAVFCRNRTLRTAVHYFIVDMAVSDLILPVITLPWWISNTYHDDLWLTDGVLGTVLCKLVWIAWPVSAWVSILSMIAIAADRFRAVLFPMKSALFSRNKRRLIIAATWVASIASQAPYLYGAKVVPHHTGLYCTFQLDPPSYKREVSRIAWLFFISLICVSAVVLTVLYSSVIISLYRQKKNLHLATEVIKKRTRRSRNIAYMLVSIVVVFYLVWTPTTVVICIRYLSLSIKLPCFFFWFAIRLSLLYPVVNPVVYYVFNEQYRQGFRELLSCSWICMNKCTNCFQPSVPPQGANNVHNAEQVNNGIELQEP